MSLVSHSKSEVSFQCTTLETAIDNRGPNVAKHLRTGGYQTALIGKWHLGEGKAHEPTGFDFWSVLPGQGEYFDPYMIEMGKEIEALGYATDVITDKSLEWLNQCDDISTKHARNKITKKYARATKTKLE